MSSGNSDRLVCNGGDIVRQSRLDNLSTAADGGRGSLNFTPIGAVPPPAKYIPQTVRPVPTNPDIKGCFSTMNNHDVSRKCSNTSSANVSTSRSQKRKPFNGDAFLEACHNQTGEPKKKVHLTDDYVAQTMSQLFISNPKPKVARRECNRDVTEAINLECLNDLEERFSNQAINEDMYNIPPLRSRKLPRRTRSPQLRLTLHQDLRTIKSSNIIPESIISRYKPPTRQNSTALVLWKPPGGIIPDVITSTMKPTRGRTRCFSEVTNTPYSSKENLIDFENCEMVIKSSVDNLASQSPISAEAPELHSPSQTEDGLALNVNLHRRNSAPEMSEPLPFLDDGSMEL